jgi:TolB-like protein/DNA-binding winged helix-turn-helix (wHTH) protein
MVLPPPVSNFWPECSLATEAKSRERVVFDDYELDCRTGELRRNGNAVKLQPQPAKVLSILVSRAGEVVTREELTEQVWGSDTYVDFEHGLNFAIRKIRTVLEDDPEKPRFVETIPKRGYRFIAAVTNPDSVEPGPYPVETAHSRFFQSKILYATTAVVLFAAVGTIWYIRTSWVGKASAAQIRSVAVLPLRNLSNDPSQEYFSDGMTDELITDLAKAGGLRVISRTSVERYKGTKAPLPEIAKQLGVDAVVEGTIMRSADRVRITAQLIDARSDEHLWADSYERDLRDIFKLQDEVARRIAGEIGTNLIADGQHQPTRVHEVDPVVHESYLRGNFYWNQLNCDGFKKARQYFEEAVSRDPDFARAYVGLAETYFTLADWGCLQPERELVAKSKAAALKALELDPSLGEAHSWLGKLAFFYEWDFPKAETELKRAIELSPNYAESHMIHAVFLVTTGRRDLGLAEMTKAHDIDPVSQLPNVISVVVFYLARQYDAAIGQGEKTIELYPNSVGTYDWLEFAYEKKGLYDQASAAFLKRKELAGVLPNELSAWRTAYRESGMHGLWKKELEIAEKNPAPDACWLARIHAHLGDREQALKFLTQASQQHCSGPHTTVADPIFDDLRQDPRFKELIVRLRP